MADAGNARAIRVAEGGEILDEVKVGMGVFACCVGGVKGTTLFVCAAPDFHEEARRAAPEAKLLAVEVEG